MKKSSVEMIEEMILAVKNGDTITLEDLLILHDNVDEEIGVAQRIGYDEGWADGKDELEY